MPEHSPATDHAADPVTGVAAGRAAPLPVVLRGGPDGLPEAMRVREVAAGEDKVKIPWLGGYEHFERDPRAAGHGGPVVFRWTLRTRIAE